MGAEAELFFVEMEEGLLAELSNVTEEELELEARGAAEARFRFEVEFEAEPDLPILASLFARIYSWLGLKRGD